jgi:RimJ/RimL family protein N-acetyltransferase
MVAFMPRATSEPLIVDVAPPERRRQALSCLFSRMPVRRRSKEMTAVLAAAERHELSLDGLLEAARGGRSVGAVWGRILPGKTALVWPPWMIAGEDDNTADLLLSRLSEQLRTGGARVAQSLLDANLGPDAAHLRRNGYLHAADLLLMACSAKQFPVARPRTCVSFEPYGDRDHRRLAKLVENTYENTRDLPMLNGVRNIDDVLDGYRQTGVFCADRWLFAKDGRKDVGCILMTDHPDEDQWELIYMGITPSGRGRGWGLEITRYGQWLAAQSGRKRIVLAVDAANQPALDVYTAAGFAIWGRRSVFLKVL